MVNEFDIFIGRGGCHVLFVLGDNQGAGNATLQAMTSRYALLLSLRNILRNGGEPCATVRNCYGNVTKLLQL